MKPKRAKSEAKQGILETADRLFYRDGIRAVGIDRIIAEAGVAKMTLYTHFPSKDDLVLAVLHYREEQVLEFFRAAIDRHGKKLGDRFQGFFAALEEWFESENFRGCMFQNTAVELADPSHAGTQFVRNHKRRFADLIRGLVEESAGGGATALVPAISLLVEGAIVTAVIQGTTDSAEVARAAALRMIGHEKGA